MRSTVHLLASCEKPNKERRATKLRHMWLAWRNMGRTTKWRSKQRHTRWHAGSSTARFRSLQKKGVPAAIWTKKQTNTLLPPLKQKFRKGRRRQCSTILHTDGVRGYGLLEEEAVFDGEPGVLPLPCDLWMYKFRSFNCVRDVKDIG